MRVAEGTKVNTSMFTLPCIFIHIIEALPRNHNLLNDFQKLPYPEFFAVVCNE